MILKTTLSQIQIVRIAVPKQKQAIINLQKNTKPNPKVPAEPTETLVLPLLQVLEDGFLVVVAIQVAATRVVATQEVVAVAAIREVVVVHRALAVVVVEGVVVVVNTKNGYKLSDKSYTHFLQKK